MGNGEKKNYVEMWLCPNIKKEGTELKSIKQSHCSIPSSAEHRAEWEMVEYFFTDLPPESLKKSIALKTVEGNKVCQF